MKTVILAAVLGFSGLVFATEGGKSDVLWSCKATGRNADGIWKTHSGKRFRDLKSAKESALANCDSVLQYDNCALVDCDAQEMNQP